MVTIIKPGVIPPKVEPWPYNGDELTCQHCGTVFTIERGDGYHVASGPHIGRLAILEGVCPFCAEDVRIYEPPTIKGTATLVETRAHGMRIQ